MSDAPGPARKSTRPKRRRNDDDFGKTSNSRPHPSKLPTQETEPCKHDPLSLAEEIAEEVERDASPTVARTREKTSQDVHISELQRMAMPELLKVAQQEQVPETAGLSKQDLIYKILKERVKANGLMFGEGTLEILPDGFGFLRSPDYQYLSCPDDIYVSPSQSAASV